MRCTLIMRHLHAHDHARAGHGDRCMRRRGTTLAVMRGYTSSQSFTYSVISDKFCMPFVEAAAKASPDGPAPVRTLSYDYP